MIRLPSKLKAVLPIALLAFASLSGPLAQSKPELKPDQLQAVWVLKFPKLVEWPASALPVPETPYRIGIVGNPKLEPTLRSILDKKDKIKNRDVNIVDIKHLNETKGCHMLIFGKTSPFTILDLTKIKPKEPILTIGEGEGFAKSGGVISFVERRNRLRFWINLKSARSHNLAMPTQFLKLAEKVLR
jgi:hypothetical protein